MTDNKKKSNDEFNAALPFSVVFLRAIVAGLGVVLTAGFAGIIAVIVLGIKTFSDKNDCDTYRPAEKITLSPPPEGKVTSARLNKGTAEILTENQNGAIILYIYEGKTGKKISSIKIKE